MSVCSRNDDNEFIVEIEKNHSIDIDFARFFAKKTDPRFGQFNYNHEDIANFLGYDRNDAMGTHARRFIDVTKRVLEKNNHYTIDDGASAIDGRGCFSSQQIKRGVKLNYWLSRVGFYEVCMASAKPKAVTHRREFGTIYELATLWRQTHKNNLTRQLPDPGASLRIATHRTNVKKREESKTELSKVKKDREDLRNALLKLEQQLQEEGRVIASQSEQSNA